jgi:hypothetical protein
MKRSHQKLIARYLAGEPIEEELLALCRKDVELLEELSRHVELERLLGALEGAEDKHEVFALEVLARLKYDASSGDGFSRRVESSIIKFPAKRRPRILWALAASVAVVLIAGLSVERLFRGGPGYARIISAESVEWMGREYNAGALLGRKPVVIGKGFVQVRFNHGTILTVEGPARFSIRDDMHVKLNYGRAVATVPLAGHGFLVESPDAHVIDLGTQFGVDVKAEEDTEVHVLRGKVKVRSQWEDEYTELAGNEAVRVARKGRVNESVAVRADRFLSELPERERLRPPKYMHWAFDESSGDLCMADGVGMDAKSGTGRLLNADSGLQELLPARVAGVYGRALFFHGEGDWIQTGFSGIAGSEPRTVAFWVKSMPGTPLRYAALGWGTFRLGQVWQISLNPEEEDGVQGSLRLGILHDQVVGTQALQDGQWHHVAIVMYPSIAGNPTTLRENILLYVDGELESTDSKSVQIIETKIQGHKAKPLYMGQSGDKARKQSFCGYMDELYVFDKALTADEIRMLMAENRISHPASSVVD